MKNIHPETAAIRLQTDRSHNQEHSVPLYLSSSFVFEDADEMRAVFAEEQEGLIYSRYANPNTDELIRKMCFLEGAEDGLATASGMAAVFESIAGLLRSGDHIVASRAVFGSTHQLLMQVFPRWGISTTYVDGKDTASWEAAITANTRMFLLETPSNPGLDLIDLRSLGQLAREKGILLNVDNCFATPLLQQPVQFGADIVTHSATKYIDGQGRVLGGLVLGRKELIDQIRFFHRHTGPSMSPFNAWVLSKSLETLAVRMERHCDNALAIAQFLESHSEVSWVKYPFLPSHPDFAIAKAQMKMGGGIISFELKGGLEAGRRFMDRLQMFSLTANLGDSRSIATHPATTTHSKLSPADRQAVGITDGLIRISIGLENLEDILTDIRQAISPA